MTNTNNGWRERLNHLLRYDGLQSENPKVMENALLIFIEKEIKQAQIEVLEDVCENGSGCGDWIHDYMEDKIKQLKQ